MYLRFIPILSVFFIACSGESEKVSEEEVTKSPDYCDCKELAFDQPYNNFYLEDRRKGFTGMCEEFYGDGSLAMQKHFNSGKVHGELIEFYQNGGVKSKRNFDQNLQTGDAYRYAQDGSITYHAKFKRGQLVEILVNNE